MNKWYFMFGTALLMCTASAGLQAQEGSTESPGTKIIIIEEKVDDQGNKTVTKTIREGDFTDEEINAIIAEESDAENAVNKGEKGYLGVMIENTDGGVRVTQVVEGSPAEACGLKTGDIIVAVDNFETGNMEALVDAISSHKPGETVRVHYLRDGSSATASVVLKEREETVFPDAFKWDEHVKENMEKHGDAMEQHEKMMKKFGEDKDVMIEKTKPRFGVYLDEAEGSNGVLVTDVAEGSVAELAGLMAGDIITSFDGTEVNSTDDLIKAVKAAPSGENIKVTFTRDGKKMKEKITFE